MLFRNTLEISGVQEDCTLEEVEAIIVTESAGSPDYDKLWFDETDGSWDNFRTSENIPKGGLQVYPNLGKEEVIATDLQTVFNLSSFTYTPGDELLEVYVNGILQEVGTDYTETDSDTVTFDTGIPEDDTVTFIYGRMKLLILNAKANLRLLYKNNNL